jgi:hypothetical protein
MKYVCLGYSDEKKWEAMPASERDALIEECLAFDEVLRKDGHSVGGGEALQGSRTARTLRRKGDTLLVTDGPYAETREQLGGFGVFEARDMDHAVASWSKHPSLRVGDSLELRPVDEELSERCQAAAPDTPAEGRKFICLGYGDERNWNALSPGERDATLAACIAYGDELRQHGGWVGGAALQSVQTAKTLRPRGRAVVVTDGPYAETKEQLGGVATLTFRDMDHAVEAWSRHPCLRIGDSLEIRPGDETMGALMAARQKGIAANAKR